MSREDIFTGERFVPGIDDDEITIEHYQRYESIKELVKGKVVVDAACGEGYGTSIIGSVAKSVTGFDISEEAVKRATETYATDTVKFEIGDITNLPLEDKSVEVFVSFETIEHVPQELQVKFVQEVSRVLKDDGMFIISSPNKEIYSDLFNYNNEFHVHEMYKQEFLDLLANKFKNVKLFDQYLEVACFIDSNENVRDNAFYHKNKETYTSDGKYFIAVASNQPVNEVEIQSVFLKHGVTYRNNMARIIELQNDVEDRNTHIKNLDTHIEELDRNIQHYVSREKELSENVEELNGQIEELNGQIEELNEQIEEYNDQIWNLKREPEYLRKELQSVTNDNYAKQDYIIQLERISEERRIELDQIRYYKKHPIRRLYRIMRRIGGKVLRKIKPVVKKIAPVMVHYKKIAIPVYKNPKVSIIIPVYNEFDYTYECVKSIIENVKNVSYEIIIGDDESTDATQRIKKIIRNVKVNINHTDHGFLMNCNRAAELAKGQYIVFLNNDTLVKENWLESLADLIESDDTIGMVGSKFIYPDGRLQEAGGIVWRDASAWNYGRYQDPNLPQFNYVRDVDYISGASIMLSKALWDEIGGFDKQFIPAYCEDTDIAFEVRKRGYRVVYQPKSVVVHFEGVSNGTELDAGLKKYQVENQRKFREKWEKELTKHNANGENVFWAKDQHQRRKTVLFIDHYVPTFDKDAGSRTVYQYIKIFVEKGYNVKFLGDNFYQSEPYASILEQMGVEVLYGVWYRDHIFEWIEENKDNIDFAFMNRPHITKNYIDFLKEKTNIRLMYYGHDLHYLRAKREAEFSNDDEKIKEANMWKAAEFDIMRKVDAVYYLSYIEKDAILEEDSSINVKIIMVNIFEKFLDDINYDFNSRKDILFVGGFSHTPNVDAICWFVKEVFPQIHKALGINLYVVGSNAPDEVKELEGNGVIIKGFVSDEELHELYGTARVAVVPLRYGAGVKGKVIEALYQGCPLVITSVGAEGIPEIEKLADVKDEPEEFAKAVIDLYGNTEELKRRAIGSQEYVKASYSVDAAWKIIEEDFT